MPHVEVVDLLGYHSEEREGYSRDRKDVEERVGKLVEVKGWRVLHFRFEWKSQLAVVRGKGERG